MRLLEQERRNRMLAERCESLTIEQARAEAELEGFKRARRAHRHSADEDACCKHRMKVTERSVEMAHTHGTDLMIIQGHHATDAGPGEQGLRGPG